MKTLKRKSNSPCFFINLFFGLFFCCYSQWSIAEFILTVAQEDTDNRPFEYFNHSGNLTGFHVDLIKAVCSDLGWGSQFIRVPWARAQILLANGQVNAVSYMTTNFSRQKYAVFLHNNILHTMSTTLYIRKEQANEIVYKPPLSEMMKRWRFGAAQDYTYTDDINQLLKTDVPVDRSASTQAQLFAMLVRKRIDVAITSSIGVMEMVKESMPNIDQYVRPLDNVSFNETPVYIAFSKKANGEKLSAEFANAYRNFRTSPRYVELVNRYNLLMVAPSSL